MVLGYWTGKNWLELRSVPFNITKGDWYSVNVQAKGTRIQVYVDDILFIDMSDSRREGGLLGFGVGPGTWAQIDDIEVTALGD